MKLPLLLVCGALLALTSAESVTVPPAEVDSHPKLDESPITITPDTSSTTTTSTTTSKPTTTTTPTTTSKPTTTKPTTTTVAPTTTTTTAKPTTTAPPKPTPAPPKPTPPPNVDPTIGEWQINYTTPANGSCIFARLAIQIEVPYHTKANETWKAYVDVPKNAKATGSCEDLTENLKLTWGNNSVEFTFDKKVNGSWYAVDKVFVNLTNDAQNFPNNANSSKTISLVYDKKQLFNTTDNKSYKCAKMQTFNMTMENQNGTAGFFHIGHLQLQAFAGKNSTGFSDPIDCEPAGTPDIVPIAAGCALAALIIIVLGAYLIGRKRSQARGYLSM